MKKDFLTAIICDDEIHMRDYLKEILMEMGFKIVAEANNGYEAIQLYNEKLPDILFIAINMPYKTGIEALKEIYEKYSDACIIIFSSLTDINTVNTCIDLGAACYIRKDTSRNRIKSIIKETHDCHLTEHKLL